MLRLRVAAVLGVVAVLALVVAIGAALAAWVRGLDGEPASPRGETPPALVVPDPASAATVRVPAHGWQLKGPAVRVYYADGRGRPAALVRGPAVLRAGYCAAHPRGSYRAFVGFTRQSFDTWTSALARSDGHTGGWTAAVQHRRVRLVDGTTARLSRSSLSLGAGRGPCSAPGVEVAMVEAADVRVVLVRDVPAGDGGGDQVEEILTSLRLG